MDAITRQLSDCQAMSCITNMNRGETHTISVHLQEGSLDKPESHDTYFSTQTRAFPTNERFHSEDITIVFIVDSKTIRCNHKRLHHRTERKHRCGTTEGGSSCAFRYGKCTNTITTIATSRCATL